MRLCSHVYSVTRLRCGSGLLRFVSAAGGAAPRPNGTARRNGATSCHWGDEHEVAPNLAAAWKESAAVWDRRACGSKGGLDLSAERL